MYQVDQLLATPRPEVYIDSCPMQGITELGRVNMTYELQTGLLDRFNPEKVKVSDYMKANWSAVVPPVPYGLTVYKGSKTFRLPRHFVDFVLNHEVTSADTHCEVLPPGGANLHWVEQEADQP